MRTWASPCLIRVGGQCYISSPTLIIIVLVLLAGFGACVCCRKKKDETYVAAAHRLLCCRSKKKETYSVSVPPGPLGVSVDDTCTVHVVKTTSPLLGATKAGDTLLSVNGKPVTPATIFDVIEAADDGTSERKLVFQRNSPQAGHWSSATAEPSNVDTRPDSPAESLREEATAPKEEEATAVAPEAEESPQETLAEEPPSPPAKSWFGRAEPEPASEEAERPPPPAKSWSFWRAEPEPAEAERPPPLSPFSALRAERERELAPLDPDA